MNNYPDGVTGNEPELAGKYTDFCEWSKRVDEYDVEYSTEEARDFYEEGNTPDQFVEYLKGSSNEA